MTEHDLYQATVLHVVRLSVRLARIGTEIGLAQQAAAVRALAEGDNADRAAWAALERSLAGILALTDGGQESGGRSRGAGAGTASGPGGAGADVAPAEPAAPVEPLLEPVTIAVPAGLVAKATAVRWWVEEEQRATEAYLFDRADDIRRTLIRPFGLLYGLESQIRSLAALLTEDAPA